MELIVDTHAHYDHPDFDPDRDTVLEALPKNGVCCVINASSDLKSAQDSIALADRYPYIFATVGIHPLNVKDLPANFLSEVKALLKHKKAIGIGEIGLDYHYSSDENEKKLQSEVFEAQLKLAVELDLPVVIHNREAHEETLTLLKKYRPKGAIHCFSGDLEMANEVIDMGMYISLGGIVTFKNAKNASTVAQNIPLEKILLETDAPCLAPEPFRGKRCDSSLIKYTAQKIAELRGLHLDPLLKQTRQNALKLFPDLSTVR
jgi:TatD DNase family protein